MERLSLIVGTFLCHQLPERSFAFGGVQFPVCARCTGMYTGLILALIILFVLYRGAQRCGWPSLPYLTFAVIAVIAIVLDWTTTFLGLRSGSNELRLLTGTMLGVALSYPIYTMLVDSLVKNSVRERPLVALRDVLLWLAAVPAALAWVYLSGLVLGPFAALVQVAFILVTFGLLIAILIGLFL
ncbi:MAG: DUF2085 domain-containing protein [Coriobacteriia bacterium]|nr:DUF2085 domain-containing protein [Coriobacteriia bacterium]